jgi:hypothetical protein
MAKQSRGDDHTGVIAPAEYFDISTTSESGADPYQYFIGADFRNSNRLDLKAFLAV